MRSSTTAVVTILGVSLAALAMPAAAHSEPVSSGTASTPVSAVPAVPADSVVDSYGVGIHLAFLDTPYRDATAVGRGDDRR